MKTEITRLPEEPSKFLRAVITELRFTLLADSLEEEGY